MYKDCNDEVYQEYFKKNFSPLRSIKNKIVRNVKVTNTNK